MINNIKHLFFDPYINSATRILSTAESDHCIKILRLKIGDIIHITNGKGNLYKTIIVEIIKKQVYINILEHYNKLPIGRSLHLAVSPLKNKDRFDFIIEKATEIGVAKITVLNCERTINKSTKIDRLTKKAISALKQSQQYYLPQIYGPTHIEAFLKIKEITESQIIIAHCLDTQNKPFLNTVKLQKNITLMIGPEGDFTKTEITQALNNNNVQAVSLGKMRLRTETAAIVASFSILNNTYE